MNDPPAIELGRRKKTHNKHNKKKSQQNFSIRLTLVQINLNGEK